MQATPPDVLVVCTANEARSPLFAVLLDAALATTVVGRQLSVASAGLEARHGALAADGARAVAASRSLSLDDHVAVALRFTDVSRCGLVIVMTRRQRRLVRRHAQVPANRVFALRELVACLEVAAPERAAATTARAALDSVVDAADRRRPRAIGPRWDVRDPKGQGLDVYERLGTEFDAAAQLLAGRLADVMGS